MNKSTEFILTYGWAILVVLAAISFLVYFGFLADPIANYEPIESREEYNNKKEMECKELCSPDKYFFSISNTYQIITCECH